MARQRHTAPKRTRPKHPVETDQMQLPPYIPDPSTLPRVPPELLTRFAEYVSPKYSLSFALTNRHFYSCIVECLRLHKEHAETWSTLRDIEPMEMVQLIRLLLRDADAAFFVRTFEVWKNRNIPADWTARAVSLSGCSKILVPYREHAISFNYTKTVQKDNNCSEQDLADFGNFMMNNLKLSVDKASKYIDRLRHGLDLPIKGILMALCPNLQTIVHVNQEDDQQVNPFEFIVDVTQSLHAHFGQNRPWPYFNNVCKIITGATHEDIYAHGWQYHTSWEEIAPLFLLPNIETLVFDMDNFDNIGGTYSWQWNTKSRVRRLVYGSNTDGDSYTFDSFMGGIDSLREIWGFNWGRFGKGQFLESLVKHQAVSLEKLDLANLDVKTKLGVAAAPFIRRLNSLKELHLAIHDLLPEVPDFSSELESQNWLQSNPHIFARLDLTYILPQSIESVGISGCVYQPIRFGSESFLCMLRDFVLSKDEKDFCNLQNLCIQDIRHRAHSKSPYPVNCGLIVNPREPLWGVERSLCSL